MLHSWIFRVEKVKRVYIYCQALTETLKCSPNSFCKCSPSACDCAGLLERQEGNSAGVVQECFLSDFASCFAVIKITTCFISNFTILRSTWYMVMNATYIRPPHSLHILLSTYLSAKRAAPFPEKRKMP